MSKKWLCQDLSSVIHCFKSLETIFKEKWKKMCCVVKSYTNGGKFSFAGNSCTILLNNVDKLQRICEHSQGRCMEFVDTFRKFKIVVDDCFSLRLRPNYEKHIAEFKESYELLNISITPKVHIIMHHIAQFCNKHQMGLGFFAEQATESSHYDFNETLKDFKVAGINEKYDAKVVRALLKYNSMHL